MTTQFATALLNGAGAVSADWFDPVEELDGWIDYFFKFNNEADAIADAVAYGKLGRYDNSSPPVWSWDRDYVIPDIKAWRPSQDSPPGSPHYLTGWFILVAWRTKAKALMRHPNLQFALNRYWTPGSPSNLVIKNNIGAIIKDVNVSNVFAGSNYPVGGF